MAEGSSVDVEKRRKRNKTAAPRSVNFTKAEKSIVIDLVKAYHDTVENKQSDAVTSKVCNITCLLIISTLFFSHVSRIIRWEENRDRQCPLNNLSFVPLPIIRITVCIP